MTGAEPANFEVDLDELERCANTSTQQMVDAMHAVMGDWTGATMTSRSRPSSLYLLVDALYIAQKRATEKMAETQHRLRDLAATYRAADVLPPS